jgi:hypothetical protein
MNTPPTPGSYGSRNLGSRRAFAPLMCRRMLLASYAAALALSVGCATDAEVRRPLETTKYTLENTDRFIPLDKPTQGAITCTGLQDSKLADGRLEVLATFKNREARRVEVQASCEFKNEQGISTGEETPWQNVVLSDNATQAVRFTALNTTAKKYTIRVRQSR